MFRYIYRKMFSREIMVHVFILMSGLCFFGRVSEGTCRLPWDGVWYDSAFPDNNVTFDQISQTVEGWKILVYSTEGTSWACLEEAGNRLLFKSTKNYGSTVFGLQYLYMYRCIQWTKLSDHVYRYYVFADEESNAESQRLYADITNSNATIATACTPSGPPSLAEFHILVKADRESSAQENCPSHFLHNFTYIHDNGVSVSCDPANGSMDGCSNTSQIAFDFTKCSAPVGFSNYGLQYYVHSETVGTIQYIVTINPEAVDYTTTFKFTCFVVQERGSYIYASDTKGSCKRTQSPTSKDGDGNAVLKMTYFDSCPFTQPGRESDGGTDVVLIAAVVVSGVLLLVTVSVIIVCCCCKKAIKRKLLCGHQTTMSKETDNEEPLKEPIDSNENYNSSSIINPETYSTAFTSSSGNGSKQDKEVELKGSKDLIHEMEQASSKSPFSQSGKQNINNKKETRSEIGQEVNETDIQNTVEQGYVEKGVRKNENGGDLQFLRKVLFLEENEKHTENSILTSKDTQDSLQNRSIELKTTENKNDNSISDGSGSILGSHSLQKLNGVSSLSNSKLVKTESSDNTFGLKSIKTAKSKDEKKVHLRNKTIPQGTFSRTGSGTQNNEAIQNVNSEKEPADRVDLKETNSHHTIVVTNGYRVEYPGNNSIGSTKWSSTTNKNDKKKKFMKDGALGFHLNDKNIKSSDSETSDNEKLPESNSEHNSEQIRTSVSNSLNSLNDYEQGPSDTLTVVIKKRTNQSDGNNDYVKSYKTTKKAEEVGRIGKKIKTSKKATNELKKINKKRQKLKSTNEISHADDELSFMESCHKSDNLSLDNFREVNSVNEDQPTAVQAWGQPGGDNMNHETFPKETKKALLSYQMQMGMNMLI